MCRDCRPLMFTILAVFVGCNAPADTRLLEPFIAAAGQYSVMAVKSSPPPTVVGDVCPACFGRGIVLMDGKTATTCQARGGTGKLPKSAVVHPPVIITPSACKDGKCPMPKSTAH